jgi:hypothetical protein
MLARVFWRIAPQPKQGFEFFPNSSHKVKIGRKGEKGKRGKKNWRFWGGTDVSPVLRKIGLPAAAVHYIR